MQKNITFVHQIFNKEYIRNIEYTLDIFYINSLIKPL